MLQKQMSIWDIEIKEKPSLVSKIEGKVTEIKVLDIKVINNITPIEIEKGATPLELTEKQQEFLNKNNIMKNDKLSRVIKYCGGGLGIELKQGDSFWTIYVNKEGKEEFTKDKRLPVLPMDKILFFKEELRANELQKEKLKELSNKAIKIIKRKGDKNIIIETEDKLLSINSLGWILEFNECKAIYEDNEIVKATPEKPRDKTAIGKMVQVGDVVQAYHGKEIIQGEIIREYGIGNEILNIIFDNGKKHTAIGRMSVIEIIKSIGGIAC